jgi:hypothetical protein
MHLPLGKTQRGPERAEIISRIVEDGDLGGLAPLPDGSVGEQDGSGSQQASPRRSLKRDEIDRTIIALELVSCA